MKKVLFLGVCALFGLTAAAQQSVVKDAERAMKKEANYAEVLKIITPAMSNPETQNDVQVYFIPGKTGFKQYDDIFALKQFGKAPEGAEKIMSLAILGGYDNFMKALPLDSVPDAKGKVKTKHSKEMLNTIAGHFHDFNNTALEFWNLKDYGNAYRCWDIYVSLPEDARFAKMLQNVPADTIMAEITYNMALAAWQEDNLENSLNAFLRAKDKGYTKKNLYDYAIAVASQLKKDDVVTALAEEALPLYGAEDANYVGYVINACLNKKEYDKALGMIDKAIANDPDNAQYYVIKGILFDQEDIPADKRGNSREQFEKAVEIDPYNPQAQFQLGFNYYKEACAINDNAPADEQAYGKIFFEQIKPIMLKAVGYLEQSYNLNEENTDALKVLESAYYLINDEANVTRIQGLMGK